MAESTKNVIMFGESGCGKSSLVNLLLGQKKAKVSDKAVGCTFNFQKYETPNFNLYDTVGLSEGVHGTKRHDFAMTELIKLMKSLEDGVSLMIFVIEKGRIKKSLNDNYKLFVNTLCMGKVPVVLVITRCEMESVQGSWWAENKTHFDKYGMKFSAVVSGSALNPNDAPAMMQPLIREINNKTAEDLLKAIASNLLEYDFKVEGGWSIWFYVICKDIVKVIGKFFIDKYGISNFKNLFDDYIGSQGSTGPDYKTRMVEYFESQGYASDEANEMAQNIVNDDQS